MQNAQDIWDERFVAMARMVASWSKDSSTKVGAVIVDAQHRVLGLGYNGFPRGVIDDPQRINMRELKYEMTVHAEANAIINAKRTYKATIYTNFFPCPNCAALIIQAGIKRVVSPPHEADERYAMRRIVSEQMFNEAGVFYI